MSQNQDTDEIKRTKRLEKPVESAREVTTIPLPPQRTVAKLPPKPPVKPRNNSLFPPFWSIVLTVLVVAICASSLVLAVLLLGGNTAPAQPPRVVVLTAAPINTFASGSTVLITPTLPPDALPGQLQIPSTFVSTFVMEGPTLPPPNITPTALSIEVGRTVRVIDVDDQQLNVRERPGVIDVPIAFLSPENSLFTIIEGPTQADGLTWWKIQDPETRRSGWAASNYLEVVP